MKQEHAIGNLKDLDALEFLEGRQDDLCMGVVARADCEIANLEFALGPHDIHRPGIALGLRDGLQHAGQHAEAVVNPEADSETVTDTGSNASHAAPFLWHIRGTADPV